MNRFTQIALVWSMGFAVSLSAQTGSKPHQNSVPALVSELQPGMSWTVERLPETERTPIPRSGAANSDAKARTRSTAEASADSPKKLLEENLTGATFRRQVLYIDGHRMVRYRVGRLIVIDSEDGGELIIESASPETVGGPLSLRRLDEFLWIEPRFHVGVTQVDGIECDIYMASWPILADTESDSMEVALPVTEDLSPGTIILAAISKFDGLPVRLEDPIMIRRYVFHSTQRTPGLPVEIASALQRQEAAAQAEIRKYQLPQ